MQHHKNDKRMILVLWVVSLITPASPVVHISNVSPTIIVGSNNSIWLDAAR